VVEGPASDPQASGDLCLRTALREEQGGFELLGAQFELVRGVHNLVLSIGLSDPGLLCEQASDASPHTSIVT
jgi:hypothetical protein